jgi:hypothetical protein
MSLEVIGSGLGRTGTKSLQSALNMLGLGPCYHMLEVFAHRECMPLWIAASEGHADWDRIFDGYRSAVDYPTAAYWRELSAYYPRAKVVHTVRDPDQWFESTQATIFRAGGVAEQAMAAGGVTGEFFDSFTRDIRGHLHDRSFLLDHFLRHTEAVQSAIPPSRLLIYDVSEGWEPLCAFLDMPVPESPFPSENSRSEFLARQTSAAEAAQEQPRST